ncbi:ribosome maturation factor RimM [Actinomyces sp. B33]|uniref:ribosome maturation factor RimM n=1 Tax=Actinomyces sp. B33 TaxID=2942131 RepID=UPI002341250E|nr:ribosome maturation factor RimM [Actinomyces sp. B33]MDC4232951.1 ribosome maturation factor RimM [Actinomyces sp. B33]
MQLTAAVIGPAHGLRGEVVLDVRSDDPSVLRLGALLETDLPGTPSLEIASSRVHKGRMLVRFVGVETREGAEALRGAALLVDEHHEEDAWYPHQLEGLAVVAPSGEGLGVVTGLQPGAAQDLLLVRAPCGEDVMVPFVRALVPEVDIEGGRIVVDAPPGLFDAADVDAGDRGAR